MAVDPGILRRNSIKLSESNQMTTGAHGTFDDIKVGDTLLPASQRGTEGRTEATDSDQTYFIPETNAGWSWDFINGHAAKAMQKGQEVGRPRLLTTEPTRDQSYDKNYLKTFISRGVEQAHAARSKTPVRDAINFARQNAPRTSGAQKVTGVAWAPEPKDSSESVESTFPEVNWRNYGGENYKVVSGGGGLNVGSSFITNDRRGVVSRSRNMQKVLDNEPEFPTKETELKPEIPGQLSLDGENGVEFPQWEYKPRNDDVL